MGVLGGVLDQLTGALVDPSTAGSQTLTQDDLTPVYGALKFLGGVIDDAFTDADERFHDAKLIAEATGAQVTVIGENVKDITTRTYDTVIPGSLKWVYGAVVLHLVDPLRKSVHTLQGEVKTLRKQVSALDHWEVAYVDPTLKKLLAFIRYFDGWPTSVLNTVRTWIERPAVFGQFAAPAVARPLITYLAASPTAPLLDDWVSTFVDASPQVWRHVEAAAVAILLTEQ